MMKNRATFLTLVVSITLAAAQTAASTHPLSSVETKKAPESATRTQRLKAAQPAESAPTSSQIPHLFPVNDSKGLLLTCTAPEIDTNADTDVFRDCTLAPGRTLDDVMHTFIGAIHYVQNQRSKEHPDCINDREEKPAQNSEHK